MANGESGRGPDAEKIRHIACGGSINLMLPVVHADRISGFRATPDDTWKVRLIEEDFHRLMFEAQEV